MVNTNGSKSILVKTAGHEKLRVTNAFRSCWWESTSNIYYSEEKQYSEWNFLT